MNNDKTKEIHGEKKDEVLASGAAGHTCSATSMFGDCGRRGCGHSIAYHVPLAGCMKCGCDEYRLLLEDRLEQPVQTAQAAAEQDALDDAFLDGVPRRVALALDHHLQERQEPALQHIALRRDVDARSGVLPSEDRLIAGAHERSEISDGQAESMS